MTACLASHPSAREHQESNFLVNIFPTSLSPSWWLRSRIVTHFWEIALLTFSISSSLVGMVILFPSRENSLLEEILCSFDITNFFKHFLAVPRLVFNQLMADRGGHTSGLGHSRYLRPSEVKNRVNYGEDFQVLVSSDFKFCSTQSIWKTWNSLPSNICNLNSEGPIF